jgi:hypothetical protein
LELNSAGEIEVAVAREVGRVVGIWVTVGVMIGVVTALVEDWDNVGVLVANEDTLIEMTVVWVGDWKPADAARDDCSLAVVAGGTITLVLLSVNLGTELVKLFDEKGVLEVVGTRFPDDELGVGF